MVTCHCDGPPHQYSPDWCRQGRGDNGKPIAPQVIIAPPGSTVIVIPPR